ncbi:putative linoleate 9S-lipoxygenase 3 [Platanthera zijinensis]|uniref:Linoleate 9S-lipoxygenase 3 n=1 Tax=Platanthera zijinensis TaxID=2320716 RepID=A0AAP0B7H7_9ASPA
MQFGVMFHVKESEGIPRAVIVKNLHLVEFFLKSITIHDFPVIKGPIHFDCNSWVYNVGKYTYNRVFFSNDVISAITFHVLRPLTEEELRHLRGDDVNMKLEEWDRVYNHAYYNDLDNMDGVPISPGRFSAAPPSTLTLATGCCKLNISVQLYFQVTITMCQ